MSLVCRNFLRDELEKGENRRKETGMSKEYSDRFSEAEKELQEKSAFVCESCNKKFNKKAAEKQGMSCCGRTITELKQYGRSR
jgi:hypothetical protein